MLKTLNIKQKFRLRRAMSVTRLTRGARPALAGLQRASHRAHTRANEPTAHAGSAQYNAQHRRNQGDASLVIIREQGAGSGSCYKSDATVNRAKVSTPSLEFRILCHVLD